MMGDRAKGREKGAAKKKAPKAAKLGRRPHEVRQQQQDALRKPL
jgi:hypothetical protein